MRFISPAPWTRRAPPRLDTRGPTSASQSLTVPRAAASRRRRSAASARVRRSGGSRCDFQLSSASVNALCRSRQRELETGVLALVHGVPARGCFEAGTQRCRSSPRLPHVPFSAAAPVASRSSSASIAASPCRRARSRHRRASGPAANRCTRRVRYRSRGSSRRAPPGKCRSAAGSPRPMRDLHRAAFSPRRAWRRRRARWFRERMRRRPRRRRAALPVDAVDRRAAGRR